VWIPSVVNVVVQCAVPLLTATGLQARSVPPSLKVTVPASTVDVEVTVAVSVTELFAPPVNDVLFVELELIVVVVSALALATTVITSDQLVTDTGSPFVSGLSSLSDRIQPPFGVAAPPPNTFENVPSPSVVAHCADPPPAGNGGPPLIPLSGALK